MPEKVQAFVDAEVGAGMWRDGYENAFYSSPPDGVEARKLMELVLTQYPKFQIDEARLLKTVERELPQSCGARVHWMVDESGSYALTDSLRVARFDGNRMIWRSRRISWDGIEFDSLEEGRLRGRAWFLGSHESPDTPFEFNFSTGELLVGQIVPE